MKKGDKMKQTNIIIFMISIFLFGCQPIQIEEDYEIEPVKVQEKINVNDLMTEPKNVKFRHFSASYLDLYKGANDYLASQPRFIEYYGLEEPTRKDFIMKKLDNEVQKELMIPFIEMVKNLSYREDLVVRQAIMLVQKIPYDDEGVETDSLTDKYPYEVLYTNTGVCGEKSELLAYIFRELGYGTAIFYFEQENHEAVGIKCEDKWDYLDTGYCFVESTAVVPYIYSNDLSMAEIIEISDGKKFNFFLDK